MGGTQFGFQAAALLNFCMKYSEKMKYFKQKIL